MNYIETESKSILINHKRVDSWFISQYGMNLYRGCEHDCVYCDGRAEKYNVTGDFTEDIVVKINAVDLLKKAFRTKGFLSKRQGYIMLGGGVEDSYQKCEEKYKIARKVLEYLSENLYPVHILTKSNLIDRDIDILEKIKKESSLLLSFSFSSSDREISNVFEPGVEPPQKRFDMIKKLTDKGFTCGIFMMPVIPYITDKPEVMDKTIENAKKAGCSYIVFGGMTLKNGRQMDYFYNVLKNYAPALIKKYNDLYNNDKYGSAKPDYYKNLGFLFYQIAGNYKIPVRIPSVFYKDILCENDYVSVILEQIDYILKLKGQTSYLSYPAFQISKLEKPVSEYCYNLTKIRGINSSTAKIINEIIKSKTSVLYENILYFKNK